MATVNNMIGKPRLKNCMKVISCPNFLLISDSTTLADAPMSVPLPPRQAPKDSAHHRAVPSRPSASSVRMMGIMVATNGMLSRKLEMTAEPNSTASMVIMRLPPVTSIRPCASMPMTPVSDMAPTMMNRPAKKHSVVHSTPCSASSMLSPEMSRIRPAAASAMTQDSKPSAPWVMKPTTTRTTMATLMCSRRRSLM